PPAGDARQQAVALVVHRHRGEELVHEFAALRPRTDQAHVTADDVPQLRQLVEAPAPQPAADRRDARIRFGRPHRTRYVFGAVDHRAELQDAERPVVEADALLAVAGRPGPWQP